MIERCLLMYMSREEVVSTFRNCLDPYLVDLVWDTLEEQNPHFFLAYEMRLRIRQQIVAFNELLDKAENIHTKPASFAEKRMTLPPVPQELWIQQDPAVMKDIEDPEDQNSPVAKSSSSSQ
uniref:Uncharacterized protein n=1 Tax=Arcella intermedia TaxID=1963864 RepID=A0A6B2LR78_9EUKA